MRIGQDNKSHIVGLVTLGISLMGLFMLVDTRGGCEGWEHYPAYYSTPACTSQEYGHNNISTISDTPPGEDQGKNAGSRSSQNSPHPFVANPVNVATGNKYEEVLDMSLSTPGLPLEFRRSYNSQLAATDSGLPLGYGWTHNFNISLEEVQITPSKRVLIKDSDGRYLYFTESSGVFTGESGVIDKLYANDPSSGYYTLLRKESSLEYVFAYDTGSKWKLSAISDPNGNALSFNYTTNQLTVSDNFGKSLVIAYSDGRITSVTDPKGQSVAYTYVNAGCPTGNLCIVEYRDAAQNVKDSIKYFYDSTRNLTDKKDTDGVLFGHWGYDPYGRVNNYYSHKIGNDAQEEISLTYPAGMTTVTRMIGGQPYPTNYITKVINGIKVIERVEGCSSCGGGVEKKYEYVTGRLEISKVTAVDGTAQYSTQYVYGNANYPWEITEMKEAVTNPASQEERTTSYGYVHLANDPFLLDKQTETKPSVLIPGENRVSEIKYYTSGTKIGKIQYRKETGYVLIDGIPTQKEYATTYDYNDNGQLTQINGPRGTTPDDVTTFVYYPSNAGVNDRYQLWKVQNALGHVTEFSQYDANGNVGKIKDPNNVETEYTYDERNRVKTIKNLSTNALTQYFYDARGNLDYIIMPELNKIDFDYNAANKLKEIKDDLGNKIIYKYNKEGNREREEIWTPPQTGYPDGILKKQLDFVYDSYNRLKKIINPDTKYTEYTYDGRGNRKTLKDPREKTTQYTYDPLSRLIEINQPGQILTTYWYDTLDNRTIVTDGNDNSTQDQWDDFGRRVKTISPDTGTTKYEYDEAGNLKKRTDAMGTVVNYVYDALNRLTNIDLSGTSEDVAFTYDAASVDNGKGRLTGRTDPSGIYTFHYYPDGRLKKEVKTIETIEYTTEYTYNNNGVITSITYPHTGTTGRKINYIPDSTDKTRVSEVQIDGSTPTPLASLITYLPFGGVTGLTYGNTLTLTQGYDNQYRMEWIKVGPLGSVFNLAYGYDANGNITSVADANNPTGGPGVAPPEVYSYQPGTNKLVHIDTTIPIDFGYDLNANITSETGWFYIYDKSNQLIEVRQGSESGPIIATYTYNGAGQRIKKVAGGMTKIFHYDQWGHLIAETNQSGQMLAEYVYLGDQLLAMIKPGNVIYYFHNDHLGTPRVLTDGSGNVAWQANYDPFGEATISVQTVENPFRFPGQYYDSETGLHYNYFRYYDPTTGRYVTPDPIGLEGGINLFVYVANQPINFVDPLGLFWGKIFGNKPGDIFTIGFSAGKILGFGFSFDRIVMPNGKADWYFTLGGGLIAPGATVSIDRGKVFRFDPFMGDKMCNYDFSKSDIKGFSVSGSVDLGFIGGEGAIAPFVFRPPGYPSPMVTIKGGLRIGTPGASLFGNWTWDL